MDHLTSSDTELLSEQHLAIVATHRSDGSMQMTPTWVDTDGTAVLFNTTKDRTKFRNLLRDPRVAVTVVDRDNAFRWLSISGEAQLIDDGADDHINRLAQKYLGEPLYPYRQPGEERVIVRVVPAHRLAMG